MTTADTKRSDTGADIPRDHAVRRSAVLFAEALANEQAKNAGRPRTPETDREIAEEIGARFFAKDVTPEDEGPR